MPSLTHQELLYGDLLGAEEAPVGRSGLGSCMQGSYGQLVLSRVLKVLLKPGRVACGEQCQGAQHFSIGCYIC